jgi:RNA polymerase sigma-70 factor (ECF subfamily)
MHFRNPRRSTPSFSKFLSMNRDMFVLFLFANLQLPDSFAAYTCNDVVREEIFPSRRSGNKSPSAES